MKRLGMRKKEHVSATPPYFHKKTFFSKLNAIVGSTLIGLYSYAPNAKVESNQKSGKVEVSKVEWYLNFSNCPPRFHIQQTPNESPKAITLF